MKDFCNNCGILIDESKLVEKFILVMLKDTWSTIQKPVKWCTDCKETDKWLKPMTTSINYTYNHRNYQ